MHNIIFKVLKRPLNK